MTTKIATCCYCGSRTALRLTARDGHELACGKCGAPLHEMKALPEARSSKKKKSKQRHAPQPDWKRDQHDWGGRARDWDGDDDDRRRRKKKRKPMWKRALGEAFDVIEDIFD